MTRQWTHTPIDMSYLNLTGEGLKTHWDGLHAGNLEPYPEDEDLQQAWRLYHLGQFAAASDLGSEIGGAGLVPAAFATTIYAQYLESDARRKPELFNEAAALCCQAVDSGVDSANLHYMHAVCMGRYSQFISMIEALAQGYGGKIKGAVERCLELAPNHAEAHITFGGWHAGITDQAGGMMARMLYGATQEGAHEQYDEAVRLSPSSPVVHLEYARGMEVMYGKSEKARIVAQYLQAFDLKPADSMQHLDIAAGRRELAKLGY